jgi:coenzyme F420-0:L-glutamate ligase/coenzyme F420-1:gamma-L-glutamate ligase
MTTRSIELIPIVPFPIVSLGEDLVQLIVTTASEATDRFEEDDIVVVTSKIVSKAEGRYVELASIVPSDRAESLARLTEKDPRLVELVLRESIDIVRAKPGVLLVRHRLGYVSACAGLDRSNVGAGDEGVLLLPADPQRSATQLRKGIEEATGIRVRVVITDSHGRPFRHGNMGVAIGIAGVPALRQLNGTPDLFGRLLSGASVVPVADLLASAAVLVSGEGAEGIPVVVIRGLNLPDDDARAEELIRDPAVDMFGHPDREYP